MNGAPSEGVFASGRQRDWAELDALARRANRLGLRVLSHAEVAKIPGLYRDLCADLARAQGAHYSAPLVEYLQGLTAAAHTVFYSAHARSRRASYRTRWLHAESRLLAFPRAVRRHGRAMLLSFFFFFVPFFAALYASSHDPHFAFRVVPEAMLRPLTEGYTRGFDSGRASGEGTLMTGYYIHNNVGIALRCFSLGVFGGLGSAIYLALNGLFTGAVVGYVAAEGAGANIFTFVVGHGSLELGAIVLAGGAGLSMGWSLVAPGESTRLASLQAVASDIVIIVFGAAVMLLMAALVEGFWSSSPAPAAVKRAGGAVVFALIAAYLGLGGRQRPRGARWT